MKISLITPDSPNTIPWIAEFERQGCEVIVNDATTDCNFLICGSVSVISDLERLHGVYPTIPIINYNWDVYEWYKTQHYDWDKYGLFLNKSREIWCPSEEVILRTEEYFNAGKKCKIIKTFARFFEYNNVRDDRYIYQPMRYYNLDRNFGWLKRACSELSLPVKESLNILSETDFQNMIACCSFMVCEYYEASTGGLTLVEGYRLGKPVLVSDSVYMGARDYFGDKATYFIHNNYEDFKVKLKSMWDNTPKLNVEECKKHTDQFKLSAMVNNMINRLEILNNA